MEDYIAAATRLIEFLRVILSWPVVVLALGLVFFFRFKAPIEALINRIGGFRFPGGAEVLVSHQTQMSVLVDAHAPAGQLPTSVETPPVAADDDPRVRNERERAALWEYRFLNTFLVPATQLVLDWLSDRPPTTYGAYDAWWMAFIVNVRERSTIIGVLENHHLIVISEADRLITVTEKGREYMTWRGPISQWLAAKGSPLLPPAPAPPAISPADNSPPQD